MTAITLLALAACGPRQPVHQVELRPPDEASIFGFDLAGVGDVDGDGFGDVVISNLGLNDSAGEVYVFCGAKEGLDMGRVRRLRPSDSREGQHFGSSVSGAGDVDGDGYADVIVGSHVDAAYLFYGGASGLGREQILSPIGDSPDNGVGQVVTGVGDLDGDGFDDVVLSSFGEAVDGVEVAGAAYVLYGGADGVDPSRVQRLHAREPVQGSTFGWAMAGVGDVDADGFEDLAIGAPFSTDPRVSGRVYLFRGGPGGVAPDRVQTLQVDDPRRTFYLGASLSGAGDLNGDGYADIVIGVASRPGSDAAWVFLGGPDGIDYDRILQVDPPWPMAEEAAFAEDVAGAGDVDGDGYDDLLIGATYDTVDGLQAGSATWIPGAPEGLDVARAVRLAPAHLNDGAMFGAHVASAGDLRGTGTADVLVGAPLHHHGTSWRGAVLVYEGGRADR
ncbi:MAG: FG-GAP repeat protein [Alphaproteobacteria bacterium]|nr:FG-GAP repeat protein [Alphaproteobacteria bacterium]